MKRTDKQFSPSIHLSVYELWLWRLTVISFWVLVVVLFKG